MCGNGVPIIGMKITKERQLMAAPGLRAEILLAEWFVADLGARTISDAAFRPASGTLPWTGTVLLAFE